MGNITSNNTTTRTRTSVNTYNDDINFDELFAEDVPIDNNDDQTLTNNESEQDSIEENTPAHIGQEQILQHQLDAATTEEPADTLVHDLDYTVNFLNRQLAVEKTEAQRRKTKLTILALKYNRDIVNLLIKLDLPSDLRTIIPEDKQILLKAGVLKINKEHNVFVNFLYSSDKVSTWNETKKNAAEFHKNSKSSDTSTLKNAYKEARKGNIGKACNILTNFNNFIRATQDNIKGLFKGPTRRSNRTINSTPKYTHTFTDDACLDYTDMKEHASKLNCKSQASGPSGMTNSYIVSLINDPDECFLHLITYLVNWIIRGYISDDDWDLINMTKGILIAKDNHTEENPKVRPICISEPLMMLADRYVKKVLYKDLITAAGTTQTGLAKNGMHICNKLLQALFEDEVLQNNKDVITVKLDIKNAFNSLDRSVIIKHLSKLGIKFTNYWKRLYSVDSIIKFFDLDDDVIMQTGTHQGRCTSPLIFDAVLMSILSEAKVLDAIGSSTTTLLRLLHDDMLYKGTPDEIANLTKLITTALSKAGLDLNKTKTEVLHHESISPAGKEKVLQWANKFDKNIILQCEGLIFGGIPFGTDNFITKTLKSKFESFSKLMDDIQHHNNIAEIDVGITLSLCRFCLSTKWMHWLRVIPAKLWKYEATTENGQTILLDIRDLVDNKIWSYFLRDLDVSSYKKQNDNFETNFLSVEETRLAKETFFLNTRNSGYGVQSLMSTSNIALIGSWSSIMNEVYNQFGDATKLRHTNNENKIYERLSILPCIKRIQYTASELNVICSNSDIPKLQKTNPGTGDSGSFDLIHDTLKVLSTSCGLKSNENEFRKSTTKERLQLKMNHLFTWMNANDIATRLLDLDNAPDPTSKDYKLYISNNVKFRAFQGNRSRTTRRYLNFTHRPDQKREMDKYEIRKLLTKDLFISPYEENNFICEHCNQNGNVSWLEHVEICKMTRATRSANDPYKATPVNRSTSIHYGLKSIHKQHFPKISDMDVDQHEPYPDSEFNRLNGVNPPADDPLYRADLLLKCNFNDTSRNLPITKYLVDITSGSIHVKSNKDKFFKWVKDKNTKAWSYTYVNNAVSKSLYDLKIKHYKRWNHYDRIIPLAFDSTGNIAPRSRKFINKLYAPSSGDNGTGVQRNWNSEIQRRFLKKNFLDSISLLFAKYRVKDIQNMDRVPLQRRLDAEAERDPIEQRRRQRAAREAREEEERRNMAREEEEGQLRLDRIREDAIIAHEVYLQDLLKEEQRIRRETTVAIEALGDATNLQNLQQETTIDLEAIQNKDVQIFMDNFNIHSLYN